MKHSLQNIIKDDNGVIRFQENLIVSHLVKAYPGGLNALAEKEFSNEDWEQLAQLIGYSVSGFGDLSYASDEAIAEADGIADILLER